MPCEHFEFNSNGLTQTKTAKVRTGGRGDRFRRFAAKLSELARGFDHVRRLVAFSAPRDGGEIRRVGLDQNAIGRGRAPALPCIPYPSVPADSSPTPQK